MIARRYRRFAMTMFAAGIIMALIVAIASAFAHASTQQTLPALRWRTATHAQMIAAAVSGRFKASQVIHNHYIVAGVNSRGREQVVLVAVPVHGCSHCKP